MRTSVAPHTLSLHYANRSHPGAGKPKKLRQAKPTAWHRSSCTAITPGIHTGNHQLHEQTCTISQSAHTHTQARPRLRARATAHNSIGNTDAQQKLPEARCNTKVVRSTQMGLGPHAGDTGHMSTATVSKPFPTMCKATTQLPTSVEAKL